MSASVPTNVAPAVAVDRHTVRKRDCEMELLAETPATASQRMFWELPAAIRHAFGKVDDRLETNDMYSN